MIYYGKTYVKMILFFATHADIADSNQPTAHFTKSMLVCIGDPEERTEKKTQQQHWSKNSEIPRGQ